MNWLDFWNGDSSVIYVNRRHLEAHYRRLLADIAPLLPDRPFTLLDYGCGEALMAPELAARGGQVLLYDRAETQRRALEARHAGQDGIRVLDDLALADLPAGSCDLILLVSVLQYVKRDQLPAMLEPLRTKLKPSGRLVLGDIVAPNAGLVDDVGALFGFAARNGFLLAALCGCLRAFVSDYRRLRNQLGLECYTPDELAGLLGGHGWSVERLGWNIGFARHRWSALVQPA